MKVPFIIYVDLESIYLKKWALAIIFMKKWSTIKINEHTPSGYWFFTHCSVDLIKNTLDCYRGKGCMESFYKDLKEHAPKLISHEK